MTTEDNRFVSAIKEGKLDESKAIKSLLVKNEKRVFNFVRRHGGSKIEAEDILIEGMTELVFNIKKDKYKGTGNISAYLFQICRLMWFQKYRSGKIEKTREPIQDVYISHSAIIEIDDKEKILDQVLNQIGAACKQVLLLWSQSFNMTEIQSEMGYGSPQVAMNKKSKCIKKLIDLVNQNPSLKQLLKDLR